MHWLLVLLVTLLLQVTFLDFFRLAGVKLDLMLVIPILYALLRGPMTGAGLGLAFGLAEDLLLGRYLGLNALTKGLTGYLVGLVEPKVFKDHWLLPVLVLFIGTILNSVIFLLLSWMLAGNWYSLSSLWRVAVPMAVYHACLAPLGHKLLQKPASFKLYRFTGK